MIAIEYVEPEKEPKEREASWQQVTALRALQRDGMAGFYVWRSRATHHISTLRSLLKRGWVARDDDGNLTVTDAGVGAIDYCDGK